jgi:hypothetical protein
MPSYNSRTESASSAVAEQAVRATLARLNGRVWGIAFALLGGLGLLLGTWILVVQGGPQMGQHLGLLSNFLPGYSVSYLGGVIGFVYGFVIGYATGRLVGGVYNRLVQS